MHFELPPEVHSRQPPLKVGASSVLLVFQQRVTTIFRYSLGIATDDQAETRLRASSS